MKFVKVLIGFVIACIAFSSHAKVLVPSNNTQSVSNDMQFKLTFNSAPILQSSGAISLYRSNGILVESINLAEMPSGTPMSDNWPWSETLNGTAIRVMPVVVDGNSIYIQFSPSAMNYNTSYYITVDQSVLSNALALGFSGIAAGSWNFTTRNVPLSENNLIVADDGTGDFATLQGALNFISANSGAKIFIKNGTYIGLAFIKNKNNYTIEGESKQGVIIKAFNNNNLNGSTHWRSVINLQGNDINLLSLTCVNTTPNGGTQAEAIKLNGERCVIANCEFYSYQDTQLLEGTVYVVDCVIEGDVDFIWGRGTVFFQSCELRANDNGGYNVMARNDNSKHGYAFADCSLTRVSGATSTQYLGRDANTSYPYAEIIYLNCTLGPQIPAVGWVIRNEMNGTGIHFAEYKSVDVNGNLINTNSRHYLSTQLSDWEAAQYRDLNWFFNGWTPTVPDYNSQKPTVEITNPESNAVFFTNEFIDITAQADDADGAVVSVEFFSNGVSLGVDYSEPYSLSWAAREKGTYMISALATDNGGLTASSLPISVTIEGYDCNGVLNGLAYTDNCGRCVGGNTGLVECEPMIAEAEDISCNFVGSVDSDNLGFSGTGFINTENVLGTSASIHIYADSALSVPLRMQFANGSTDRPMQVLINGAVALASVSMRSDGWDDYKSVEVELDIVAGINIITFVALSDGGLANLDYYALYGNASFAGCTATQEVTLHEGWNLVSLAVYAEVAAVSSLFPNAVVCKTMSALWNARMPNYFNGFSTINSGCGYLVYTNSNISYTFQGPLVETMRVASLETGWNIIGITQTQTIVEYFGSELDSIQEIKDFESFWEPNGSGTLQTLEAGKAYFVKK